MSANRKCKSCGYDGMYCLGGQQVQLAPTGFKLGQLSTPAVGSLDVEIWECPVCGKIDFYRKGSSDMREEGAVPQVICLKCGTRHDLDDPTCPGCGVKNPNI